MRKHMLSLGLSLFSFGLHSKIHIITPPAHLQKHRSGSFMHSHEDLMPEGNKSELYALWQELLMHDTQYKIGIFCESLEPESTTMQPSLGILQLCPLAYLKNVSIYTYDTFEPNSIPEKVDIKCFTPALKQSSSNMEAVISCLDAVITGQLKIADLALSLNKEVWFIQKGNVPLIRAPHKNMHVVNCSENGCRVAPLMHEIMQHMRTNQLQIITAEIPVGELIDKITILDIKTERITDANKLENIRRELSALRFSFDECITVSPELEQLIRELKSANEALWETEDLIRNKEREKSFDEEFIKLARAVYMQNDERCRAKRSINELLGSRLIEEKSYKPY